MNKKIVHDALILTAFTLVLGFLLGVVYDITKEPIAAAEKAALDEAYKVVFINVTSHEGSQADISFSVGVQNDGTLNGYSITSISETPGLGVLVQEEPFYSQFEGKTEETYSVVKTAPAAENEIQAVTGATISSRAVTNGVNACLVYFRNALQGGN